MKIIKIITLLMMFCGIASAQVAVIANKSVSENAIDKTEIEKIYQLKSQRWNSGQNIVAFDYMNDSNTKTSFYSALGTTSQKMKKIWLKAKLSGEGIPPEALGSEEDMISKVSSTPGAIGFIDASRVNDNVKVLATF